LGFSNKFSGANYTPAKQQSVLYHLLLCFLSHIAYHVTIIWKFHYGYQYMKNNADSKINSQVTEIQ
jgi:hypothetical protein